MKTLTLEDSVAEWVTQVPARARVFERLGIDYCCGGKKRLADVCAARGLSAHAVRDELAATRDERAAAGERDWRDAPLGELCDYIERRFHAALREDLPRLAGLLQRVVKAHGERHPEMREVALVFDAFRDELGAHMMKEERVLFPAIRDLERNRRPTGCCAALDAPIAAMEHEHENAGRALERMHELTGGYRVPDDGCTTYRVLLDGLATLEREMHEHVHLENNVLFPRAESLARGAN